MGSHSQALVPNTIQSSENQKMRYPADQLVFLTCFMIIGMMAYSTSGRSILNPKALNPCSGKSYCETPTDYPAELIRNLLSNKNIPHGLFNGKLSKIDIRENSEMLNNDIYYSVSDQNKDVGEIDKLDEISLTKEVKEAELASKYSKEEKITPFLNGIFSL